MSTNTLHTIDKPDMTMTELKYRAILGIDILDSGTIPVINWENIIIDNKVVISCEINVFLVNNLLSLYITNTKK